MSLAFEQLFTFLVLTGAGMGMALAFDIYRVFRGLFKLPKLIYDMLDLLIWMALALMVFYLLVLSNWGQLRFYIFISLLLGMGIYFMFLSTYVLRLLRKLIEAIKSLWRFSIKVISWPIRLVGRILMIPVRLIMWLLEKVKLVLGKVVSILIKPIAKPLEKLREKGEKITSEAKERLKRAIRELFGRNK